LFAAETEEARGGRCNFAHLDYLAGNSDNLGHPSEWYHQRKMHSVGRLQQLRNGKSSRLAYHFHRILLATGMDGGLLLKNCLLAEK